MRGFYGKDAALLRDVQKGIRTDFFSFLNGEITGSSTATGDGLQSALAYNCNTLQAIDRLGDRIIDYMTTEKTQALRDENQALRLAASQEKQTQAIINEVRPCPVPAFITCNPYASIYNNGIY